MRKSVVEKNIIVNRYFVITSKVDECEHVFKENEWFTF